MRHTDRKDLNPLYNLKKSSTGCVPCLNEALKIEKKVNKRSLNQIKISEIKKIVNSIFESANNDS